MPFLPAARPSAMSAAGQQVVFTCGGARRVTSGIGKSGRFGKEGPKSSEMGKEGA